VTGALKVGDRRIDVLNAIAIAQFNRSAITGCSIVGAEQDLVAPQPQPQREVRGILATSHDGTGPAPIETQPL